LPRLLERAGRNAKGTITGVYTVLVDGDDFNEPIADSVRSILDGHIVLTRELADQGHYPSIDVLRSISRLRPDICPKEIVMAGRGVLGSMATFKKVEDMINIGAYAHGANADIDRAIVMMPHINAFLQQDVAEPCSLPDAFSKLQALAAEGDNVKIGPGVTAAASPTGSQKTGKS
jgi:flagellum-specific ATP synthase